MMYQGRGCENKEELLVFGARGGEGYMRDIFTWDDIVRILCAAFEVSCERVNTWRARREEMMEVG